MRNTCSRLLPQKDDSNKPCNRCSTASPYAYIAPIVPFSAAYRRRTKGSLLQTPHKQNVLEIVKSKITHIETHCEKVYMPTLQPENFAKTSTPHAQCVGASGAICL